MNYLKKQVGISLIEILITIVIVTVGLLGIAASQSVSIKETGNSAQRTAATMMITELVERMRMNRDAVKDYKTAITANCATPPSVVCGTGAKGNAIVSGGSCTTKQKAQYDVWDVLCDKGNTDAKSSTSDYLASKEISMTCLSSGCPSGGTVQFDLSWKETKNKRKTDVSLKQALTLKTAL